MLTILLIVLALIVMVILYRRFTKNKNVSKAFKISGAIAIGIIILLVIVIVYSGINNNVKANKIFNEYMQQTYPWDTGFNVEWAGTYLSDPDMDYVIGLKIGVEGIYALRYGSNPNIATSYTGKYDRNFDGGTTNSPLNYKINGFRVLSLENNIMSIAVDWEIRGERNTEYYRMKLEYK